MYSLHFQNHSNAAAEICGTTKVNNSPGLCWGIFNQRGLNMSYEKALDKLEELETHYIMRIAECKAIKQEIEEKVKNEEFKRELIAHWDGRIDELGKFLTVLLNGWSEIY
jgi:hypothetical protein